MNPKEFKVFEQDGNYCIKLLNMGNSIPSVAFTIESFNHDMADFITSQLNLAYRMGWNDAEKNG